MFSRSVLLCLLFFCLFNTEHAIAQDIIGQPKYEYAPKTPAVAAMQQFVDVPMNYFSGQPEVTVPLIGLTSKSLQVNITLAYQGGGIKAEQQTGIVGLGWSLKYGGMISRTVRGNPDEGIRFRTVRDTVRTWNELFNRWDTSYVWAPAGEQWSLHNKYGGFYVDRSSNLSLDAAFSLIAAHNNSVKNGSNPNDAGLELFTAGLSDGEPDMFYFNFEGHSGKFFFNKGEPTLIPYDTDLRIITKFHYEVDALHCTNNYFDSFVILTPEGKEYHFGETVESKISANIENTYEKPNAWALTSVIDRNSRDTIYYDYLRKQSYIKKPTPGQKLVTASNFSSCIDPAFGSTFNRFYESRLMKVRTRKEEIRFYYSDVLESYTETNRLDSIRVFDIETLLPYKKIQFDYSQFKSRRLKLNSCVISDGYNHDIMPYQFKYYDTAFQKHPTRTTEDFYSPFSQDFWGYYNDNTGNEIAGSLNVREGCSNNGSRNSAWPQMQRDALLSIIYPTGGNTSFEYEPHDFSTARMMNGNIGDADTYQTSPKHNFTISSIVGGLRVKKILIYDPVGKDTLVRRISYKRPDAPTLSSGHLYISPSVIADASSPFCGPVDVNRYFLSTYNMIENVSGDEHIGYNNVRVFEESDGVAKGYTDYEYYTDVNTDSAFYFNLCDSAVNICYANNYDIYPNWFAVKHKPNLLSGKEKSKKVYSQAAQLLQEEKTIYGSIKYSGISRAIVISSVLKNEICTPPSGVGSITPPANAISRVLAPNLSFYFLHSYVIGKMAVLPKESIIINYDASGSLKDTLKLFYESPYHINSTRSVKASSKQEAVVSESVYGFDFTDGGAPDSTFLYMKKRFFNPLIATFTYKAGTIYGGGYRKFLRVTPPDTSYILPVEEYAFSSTTGETPVAINLTAGYPKAFAFTSSKFEKAVSFSYDVENSLVQVEKKGGKLHALLWDSRKNDLIAEVINAAASDIAYTSFELPTNGGWTVPSGSRVNGGMTGKKAYNLSSGAVSRAGIPTGKKYIVSYWSSGAAANVNSVSATTGMTKQGWTYYEHVLPNTTSSISITGSVDIDELRLYPVTARMNTYVYEPMMGVSSISTDNNIQFYNYDGSGRLQTVRDAGLHIMKAYDYHYTGYGHSSAVWLGTGATRCKPCDLNNAYNSNILQLEQIDMNPGSSTYGNKRWFDSGTSGLCPAAADWQNTVTAVRCKQNVPGQNTGEQEQEQRDLNPCSATYNTTRWVVIGTNTTICPVCTGDNKKIINGICETGNRVNLSSQSVLVGGQPKYKCTFRYEWSDCSKSPNYEEIGNQPCTLNTSCDDW